MNKKLISAVAIAALMGTGLTLSGEAAAVQYSVVKEHVDYERHDHGKVTRNDRNHAKKRMHVDKRVRMEKHVYVHKDRKRHDRGHHYGQRKSDRFERYYRYHEGRDYYRPRHKHHAKRWKKQHHKHHRIERTRQYEPSYRYEDNDRPRIRFRIDYNTYM